MAASEHTVSSRLLWRRGYWWGVFVGAGVWIPCGIGLERLFH